MARPRQQRNEYYFPHNSFGLQAITRRDKNFAFSTHTHAKFVTRSHLVNLVSTVRTLKYSSASQLPLQGRETGLASIPKLTAGCCLVRLSRRSQPMHPA
eukprot:1740129-Amphidinium_carterae.1